jgi:hypothetical protein
VFKISKNQIFLIIVTIFLEWYPVQGGSVGFNEIFKLEDTIELQRPKNESGKGINAFRIGRDGRIWTTVGSPGKSEVLIYSPKGEIISAIHENDIPSIRGYSYTFFTNLAFDQKYQVYILESVSGNVVVTDSMGRFLRFFGAEHDNDCRAGAVDIEVDKEDDIFIGGTCYQEIDICPESRNYCIHKYNSTGQYIKSFFPFEKKLFDLTPNPDQYVLFDFDPEENIWCVHPMVYQIFEYSSEGKPIQSFPGKSLLYKPPIKLKKDASRKEEQSWWKSWTILSNLTVLKPNLILLFFLNRSPLEGVIEIYDQGGKLFAPEIQTHHYLLGKDEKGFLYFLLDIYDEGKKNNQESTIKIGKFSLNVSQGTKLQGK